MSKPMETDLVKRIRELSERLIAQPGDQPARLELIQAYSAAGRVDDFLREAETYKAREKADAARAAEATHSPPPATQQPPTEVVPGFFDPVPVPVQRKRFGTDEAARLPLETLAAGYDKLRADPGFLAAFDREMAQLAGRPTPLFYARRLSLHTGGARIYFKQENTGRTDPHLSIAAAGQVHVARALGRKRVYAGVRDLHWGVRVAAACARFGVEAEIFVDEQLQDTLGSLTFQMQLMGARVTPVRPSRYPHSDIREAALAAWLKAPDQSFLFMGLDSGPDPYPQITRDLTAVIGREVKREIAADAGRGPDMVVVRGGENADALGALPAFLEDKRVRLCCVEPEPLPARENNKFNPFFVPDTGIDGARAHAILEGLEYESVARERKLLRASGRVEYVQIGLEAARDALRNAARFEGVTMGLETAHAVAYACEAAKTLPQEGIIAVLLAERPDKDLWDVARLESLGV